MYKIQFGSAADRPSLLVFPSKGDLTFNVVLSADTPSVIVPAVTDEMLTARNHNWITIYIIQPGTPETEAALSLYVQPGMPIPPADSSNWTPFTALNSWVPIVGGTPSEYRRVGENVSVRFAVQSGVSLTVWTAPVGFRSKYVLSKGCQIHDNTNAPDFGHIQVRPNGDIVIEHPGALNNHKVWADFTYPVT